MPEVRQPGAVVVRVAGRHWGIPTAHVVEVLRDAPLSRIPGVGRGVRGLVSHRGQILTVADLGVVLVPDATPVESPEIVVLQLDNRRFAVAVDAVVELVAQPRTSLALVEVEQIAQAILS